MKELGSSTQKYSQQKIVDPNFSRMSQMSCERREKIPENQRKCSERNSIKKVKNKTTSTTTMDPAKGYQSSKKILHDYQHSKHQLSS